MGAADHGVRSAGAPLAEASRTRASSKTSRSTATIVLGMLAVGVLAAYVAVERGQFVTWDGRTMASVGLNIWRHGSITKCCNAFGADPSDHSKYSKYGIGYSLLTAPFWGLQLRYPSAGVLFIGLANPLLLTASALMLARTGIALGWRLSTAVLTSLAFAFLTMALFYSTSFLAEPGVTLGSALALFGIAIWRDNPRRGAPYIGIGVAVATVFRPDSLVLFLPLIPCLVFAPRARLRLAAWRTWASTLAGPVVMAVAWSLYYNRLRYGSLTGSGYTSPNDRQGFSTPLLRGMAILLWSPGKSFFVYSPILLLAVPGLYWLARRRPELAAAIALLSVLRVCFYARWWTPVGGASWGPRFLVPLCLLLAVPLGQMIEHVHTIASRIRRVALTGSLISLAALSGVVQFASVAVPFERVIRQVRVSRTVRGYARSILDAQRTHQYIWTFGGSHVIRNLAETRAARFSSLYFFSGRVHLTGVVLLIVAAFLCTSATLVSIRHDVRTSQPDD